LEQRAAAREEIEELGEVVAELPLEELAVGLRRGRTNMLTIATVHGNKTLDEIYCFCDDPARRNRWVALFRGMGVAIFDLRDWNSSAAVPRPTWLRINMNKPSWRVFEKSPSPSLCPVPAAKNWCAGREESWCPRLHTSNN